MILDCLFSQRRDNWLILYNQYGIDLIQLSLLTLVYLGGEQSEIALKEQTTEPTFFTHFGKFHGDGDVRRTESFQHQRC